MAIDRRMGNGRPATARLASPAAVRGQTMTEYALILAAVASVVFLGMKALGKAQNSLSATAGSVSVDLGSSNAVDNMIDK
jgi:Flp pilus assembly pilin Flp